MGLIIKARKHLYTRVPVILILIGLFALSPIFISMLGAWLTELSTGQPCHEGNCSWGAFGWLFLLTFPLAGIIFVVFIIIVIRDTMKLSR